MGGYVYDHPWRFLLVIALLVAGLSSQIGRLYFETRLEEYLQPDDPVRVGYNTFREQYGRDEIILVAFQPPEVFDLNFLTRLRDLQLDLEDNLPYLDEATSLVNARQTRAVGDTLIVDDFLQDWPETQAELQELRAAALDNPFYRNSYLSANGRTTGLVLQLETYNPEGMEVGVLDGFTDENGVEAKYLTSDQTSELIAELERILSQHSFPDTQVAMSGNPIVSTKIQSYIGQDMFRFSGLAILLIGVLLFGLFRRLSGLFLPLICVVLAQLSTLGAMGATGSYIDGVNQMIPSFILAVGVGYAVHIIAIAFQRLDAGASKRDAVVHALEHSGTAVLMAGLTTTGGIASFVASEITSVRSVGTFIPTGVLFSVFFALVFLPAALSVCPIRPRASGTSRADARIEAGLAACGRLGVRHPGAVTLVSLAVVATAASGAWWLSSDYDPLDWLPRNDKTRTDILFVDRELGGATNIEVVVDTGRENGLHDPKTLEHIEAIQEHVLTTGHPDFDMVKATSLIDVSKEVHRALNRGETEYYKIPEDPILLAQELLLFETSGSDDLEDLVDSTFREARISFKGEWAGSNAYRNYIVDQKPVLERLAGDLDFYISGTFYLSSRLITLIHETATRSYSIAFLLITPLMMLFIGSLRIGLISMVPNLAPILMVVGLMGWIGIAVDFLTLMVAGVALALVVDDTIHILNGFRRDFADCGDVEEAVIRTMRTTGRALLLTTLVLVGGFALFAAARMINVNVFGLLTATVVFLAFVLDLFLSPALLALVYRDRNRDNVTQSPSVG